MILCLCEAQHRGKGSFCLRASWYRKLLCERIMVQEAYAGVKQSIMVQEASVCVRERIMVQEASVYAKQSIMGLVTMAV